jgi:hypothetical protein
MAPQHAMQKIILHGSAARDATMQRTRDYHVNCCMYFPYVGEFIETTHPSATFKERLPSSMLVRLLRSRNALELERGGLTLFQTASLKKGFHLLCWCVCRNPVEKWRRIDLSF